MPTCRYLSLFLVVAAGCAMSSPPMDADSGAFPDAPITCELGADGSGIVLDPAATNPAACAAPVDCRLWFGHGQHMTCPSADGSYPPNVRCSIRDCLCEGTEGFEANFATGDVVDVRGAEPCAYRMRYLAP